MIFPCGVERGFRETVDEFGWAVVGTWGELAMVARSVG